MKYFTAQEAKAIMNNGGVLLCTNWDENPALDQAIALRERVNSDMECRRSPIWAAAYGFILGRATGIREERQRRKGGPEA